MKTVQAIIDVFGGMAWLKRPGNWIRLEQPNYDRLVIEHVGTGPFGRPLVSVAHYYEQNGDAMRDPEMVFLAGAQWVPMSYQNDGVGVFQEAVEADSNGRVRADEALVKELAAFAAMWDRNIHAQHWLNVAKAKATEIAARN